VTQRHAAATHHSTHYLKSITRIAGCLSSSRYASLTPAAQGAFAWASLTPGNQPEKGKPHVVKRHIASNRHFNGCSRYPWHRVRFDRCLSPRRRIPRRRSRRRLPCRRSRRRLPWRLSRRGLSWSLCAPWLGRRRWRCRGRRCRRRCRSSGSVLQQHRMRICPLSAVLLRSTQKRLALPLTTIRTGPHCHFDNRNAERVT
jgi:hypothetical protein